MNKTPRPTPRLKDDSSTNLSANGLLNRQPTPPSPPTQYQYPYPSWRSPPHGGLPPSSYWGFRDSSLIPQGFRPVFLPIVDILHNHFYWLRRLALECHLIPRGFRPVFLPIVDILHNHFYWLRRQLLNATLSHKAIDLRVFSLSIFRTITLLVASTGL
jgi:hypothetical protein